MSDQTIIKDEIPEPFESYTGHDPYIFVSYARLDKSFVYNTLQIFHDAKVNIWYDEASLHPPSGLKKLRRLLKSPPLCPFYVTPGCFFSLCKK